MPAAQLKRYPAILVSLISRTVARTGLSDVTDTSRFKRFLASVARELDEVYYQLTRVADTWALSTASGEDLDRRVADLQPAGLIRVGPRRATGTVVFFRRSGSGTQIIPAGTIGVTASGVAIRTTREGEITDASPAQLSGHGTGEDSAPIPAVAVTPGEIGNLVAGSVTRIQGSISGVDGCYNTAPFLNGRDQESDDELRGRAKAYIASLARCDVRALEFAALGVSDGTREVIYAHAVEDPVRRGEVTLYIDDGNGTSESTQAVENDVLTLGLLGPPADSAVGGEEYLQLELPPIRVESGYEIRVNGTALIPDSTVFVSPTDGVVRFDPALENGDVVDADYVQYTGLIAAVQTVIDGVAGDADLPGYGAAGVMVRVKAPTLVSAEFAGTLFLREKIDRDAAVVAAQAAIVTLVNGLGIGEDIVLAQLIDAVMEVPGVEDFVLETPTENVVVLDDEIARISLANVDMD